MTRLALNMIVALSVVASLAGCNSRPKPETVDEKSLFALGVHLGTGLVPLELSPRELQIVQAGLAEGAAGHGPDIDDKTGEAINTLMRQRNDERAAAALQKGPALIEKASHEAGAALLPSGIVFRELVAGTGAPVVASGKVKAHLHGTLGDGTLIEDTQQRGRPMVLPVDQVMPCWSEPLKRMKVGGKARVVCPPATAFALFGKPPIVPANSTVIYELEVMDAEP